jgi:membrane protein implicated in regulation of membrane protease activity
MPFLYLIAIAWVYVVMLMALTEVSVIAGIMTFLFFCALPLTVVFYLMLAPSRKRRRDAKAKEQSTSALQAPVEPDPQ